MNNEMLIVGGGIGGLAAALACARTGAQVQLLEQSPEFGEVGAGIQLGPNVVRVLESWGLGDALRSVAAFPQCLRVRNAMNGRVLGELPLDQAMVQRYGASYATIARADMHGLLLEAVRGQAGVQLHLSSEVTGVEQDSHEVRVRTLTQTYRAPVLVGADGVWSRLRKEVVDDGPPRVTGHLAFRTLVPQADLPERLRSQVVTAWMGRDFHVVQYPVRRGEMLNVVAIVHGKVQGDPKHWDHSANAAELRTRLADASTALRDLVAAIPAWRLWALSDRPPMRSAAEHARGRIALLGDAAHPMRPYLAQGAGMAIEDADALANVLMNALDALPADVPAALQAYASQRWQRNARVQARAIRNGEIFHLQGPMQLGRDLSLRLLGQKLLDVPWLYSGPTP
ncbi:MAG: FAD-dependent monooxygenase [Burkholderiales bacterium]|nr:FAD-dependent monooxygenase [Burkholderiales bacterium]